MKAEHFAKARTLADKLTATCEPNTLWDELNDLTREECAVLDAIAFECQGCNHWFPVAQRHEGTDAQWYCGDCLDT